MHRITWAAALLLLAGLGVAGPGVTQPAVTQPAVTQPAVAQSAVAQPAVAHQPMEAGSATPVLGRPVMDQAGQAGGRIVDVLVDGDGQARAAVVDVGGFMGLGQRRIAVAWRALRFNPADGTITLLLPAGLVAAAPEWRAGTPATIVSPPD